MFHLELAVDVHAEGLLAVEHTKAITDKKVLERSPGKAKQLLVNAIYDDTRQVVAEEQRLRQGGGLVELVGNARQARGKPESNRVGFGDLLENLDLDVGIRWLDLHEADSMRSPAFAHGFRAVEPELGTHALRQDEGRPRVREALLELGGERVLVRALLPARPRGPRSRSCVRRFRHPFSKPELE